jgi:hypothetical protein
VKKNVNQKTLKLGKEVVRALDTTELSDVAGGVRDTNLQCQTGRKTLCC